MPMTGEKVPMAFFPRLSTFTSIAVFWTQPIDMIGFEEIQITAFRSVMTGGGGPTLLMYIQESADGLEWQNGVPPFDPDLSATNLAATIQKQMNVQRRFVRMGLEILTGTAPTVTVFAVGWAARTM